MRIAHWSILATAAFLAACGQKVEVPPAHLGKIMTKDGYQEATPTYMPKADVKALPNPGFQPSQAEVQDRLRQPELSTEERAKRFDEKFDAVKQATEGK